jgi:hypothetical protein
LIDGGSLIAEAFDRRLMVEALPLKPLIDGGSLDRWSMVEALLLKPLIDDRWSKPYR